MTTYSIRDLGTTVDDDYPLPYSINDAGVVSGRLLHSNRPFRYANGILVELPLPSSGKDGIGRGMSPSQPERIVGWSMQFDSDRAVMWENGFYFDLHPLIGVPFTEAYDVNDSGVVTGWANGKGFRLDTTTQQVELLSLPNGDSVFPNAINASGHVVGNSGTPDVVGSRLFFCDQTVHVIPTPGDIPFEDTYVNDADVIASCCNGHAFTYDFTSGVFTDIHGPAFAGSRVHGINNHGAVVGVGYDDAGSHAMIWTASHGMRRLINHVDVHGGWRLSEAYAINDEGEITGRGIYYGQPRGFLLTPVSKSGVKPGPKGQVGTVQEIVVADGGVGILLPDGDVVYPKDGPVDPDSPLQRQDAARLQRDIADALEPKGEDSR